MDRGKFFKESVVYLASLEHISDWNADGHTFFVNTPIPGYPFPQPQRTFHVELSLSSFFFSLEDLRRQSARFPYLGAPGSPKAVAGLMEEILEESIVSGPLWTNDLSFANSFFRPVPREPAQV